MVRPERLRIAILLWGAMAFNASHASDRDDHALDLWARHVYARSILGSIEVRERLGLSLRPGDAAIDVTPARALERSIDQSFSATNLVGPGPTGESSLSDAFWVGATRRRADAPDNAKLNDLLLCALADGAGAFDASARTWAWRRDRCWLDLVTALGMRAIEQAERARSVPSPSTSVEWATVAPRWPLDVWRRGLVDDVPAHESPAFSGAVAAGVGEFDRPFREALRLRAPADGVFAALDHAVPHAVDARGYPRRRDDGAIFGFTRVRVNVLEGGSSVGETTKASDETWIALARYHRNPCYRADLSGEAQRDVKGQSHLPVDCADNARSNFEEVSLSRPLVVPHQDGERALAFDFSAQPVPINATDLVVQVIRRDAKGDPLAIGLIDVREPTYLLAANHSDIARCDGAWSTSEDLPRACRDQGPAGTVSVLSLRLCVGGQLLFEHLRAPHGALGPGDFVRVAVLLDGAPRRARARFVLDGPWPAQIRDQRITGRVVQADTDDIGTTLGGNLEPLWRWRGLAASTFGLSYHVDDRREALSFDATPPRAARRWDIARASINTPSPGELIFPDTAVNSYACSRANDALTSDRALAGDRD